MPCSRAVRTSRVPSASVSLPYQPVPSTQPPNPMTEISTPVRPMVRFSMGRFFHGRTLSRLSCRRPELLEGAEHLGGVAGHLDLAPRPLHTAVRADHEGAALAAHVGSPVHRLLHPDP